MKSKGNSYYMESQSKDKHVRRRTLYLYSILAMQSEFDVSIWYMLSV